MFIAPDYLVPGTSAHAERMRRIDAYLSGAYRPLSVLDVEYNGRVRGPLAQELLMAFLRLLTDAKPESVPESRAQPTHQSRRSDPLPLRWAELVPYAQAINFDGAIWLATRRRLALDSHLATSQE
jgi:hypothetical protein